MASRLLRNRYFLPAALLVAAGVAGMASFASDAGATTGLSSGGGVGSGNFNSGVALPPEIGSPSYLGGIKNTGGANSTTRTYAVIDGKRTLVAYGNSAITYQVPPASYIAAGEALFAQNCASCHGSQAEGSAIAPNLVGVGPATVDFWVSTGRMPAATTNTVQAERKPPRLNATQALQIAAWVNSLSPAVPFVPYPNLKGANLSTGFDLFALNCASCHTIEGMGNALGYGTFAPSLKVATAQQVAEAIRTGPANMPRFTGNLTDTQVRDIVAYVTTEIQHPVNPGGAGLGGVGPVAEGFVGLLIGVGGLALVSFWIGDRA